MLTEQSGPRKFNKQQVMQVLADFLAPVDMPEKRPEVPNYVVRDADGNVMEKYTTDDWKRCFATFVCLMTTNQSEEIFYGRGRCTFVISTEFKTGIRTEIYSCDGEDHIIQRNPDGSIMKEYFSPAIPAWKNKSFLHLVYSRN